MKCTHIRAYGYNRDFFLIILLGPGIIETIRSTEDEITAEKTTTAAIGEEVAAE